MSRGRATTNQTFFAGECVPSFNNSQGILCCNTKRSSIASPVIPVSAVIALIAFCRGLTTCPQVIQLSLIIIVTRKQKKLCETLYQEPEKVVRNG